MPLGEIRSARLDRLSYVSIPLKILSIDDTTLAECTGFIYEKNSEHFLITNWHNFTGKNNVTKSYLHTEGFVLPTKVQIPFHKSKTPHITWERTNYEIIDGLSNPKWLVHPTFKEEVDVVALKIVVPDGIILHPINHEDFNSFNPVVSDDVFILGFPYSIRGGGNFPIWKRATIASEPDLDLEYKPKLLVDTASRRGMSGSPVIFRRDGIHGLVDGTPTNDTVIGEIQNFVGVYSGHHEGETAFEAQLGVVWKRRVIDEIIDGNNLDIVSS